MMSQNNTDKAAMRNVIATINAVEGVDPEPFAVEYADLESGETRKRLPGPDGMVPAEISRREDYNKSDKRKGLLCGNGKGISELQRQ